MLHPNITLLLSCVVIVGFGSLRVLLMTKISVFKKIFVQKTWKTIILDSKIEHSLNMNQTSIKELDLLYPSLGMTKEIMSQGPQVLDMEYRGSIFLLQHLHPVSSSNIHPVGLVLQQQWVLLHEVMSLGIMVCVTLIPKTFEYVHLIILLHEEILAFQNHPSTSYLKHLQKSIA
jgi:hypothetical protein